MMTYMWALYAREVKRFQKLWMDTLFSPIVSIALYLAVFGVLMQRFTLSGVEEQEVSQLAFIYTGLLAMIIINSSFSNPGFALVISKNTGTIIDLQFAPLRPWKIGVAYALAALTRAVVALLAAVVLTVWFVDGVTLVHPVILVCSILLTGVQYGMLGVVFGMWARDFQSISFMTSFIMQPLVFLGGAFYPLSVLSEPWSTISFFNPVYHNIHLFRYALLDFSDIDPLYSWTVVLSFFVLLFALMCYSTSRNLKKPLM